jgi:hypothetical protein
VNLAEGFETLDDGSLRALDVRHPVAHRHRAGGTSETMTDDDIQTVRYHLMRGLRRLSAGLNEEVAAEGGDETLARIEQSIRGALQMLVTYEQH